MKNAHESELKKIIKFFCDKHVIDINAKISIKNEAIIIVDTKQVNRNLANVAYVYSKKMSN